MKKVCVRGKMEGRFEKEILVLIRDSVKNELLLYHSDVLDVVGVK
jgi:hypothetical protein